MTIRQNIPAPVPGQEQLPNGYAGSDQPSEFYIPPCGIEDVDMAMFNLFNQELGFASQKLTNGANGPVNIKKPTVIFATGERFAIVKKLRPLRDRNGALMLPAISIRRTGIEQTAADMTSRGMNQTTGELIIKKRLDPADRSHQNFINKLLLQNSDLPETRRTTGENAKDESIQQGMLLDSKLGNNIFEIITIPQPQFYTATYEVVFWTSFTQHMSYMIETALTSQLPQGKTYKLTTDKGYWFIAQVDEAVQSQENFDDFTEQERIIRYAFTIKVPAFLLATNGPGRPVPFKKYFSAVDISFEIVEDQPPITKAQLDQAQKPEFILNDMSLDVNAQALTTLERYVFKRESVDPKTGRSHVNYVTIMDRNHKKGETVYTASDQESLDEFLLSLSPRK